MTHWRAVIETWRSLTRSKTLRFAALLGINLLILGALLLPTAGSTTAISFNRLNPDVVDLASAPLINNIFNLFAPQAGTDVCDASTTRIIGAFPYNDSGTTVGMTDNYDLPPDTTNPTCTAPTTGTGGGPPGSLPRGAIYTGTGTGPDAAYVVKTDQACTLQITMDPTGSEDLGLIVYEGQCSSSLGDCVVVDDSGVGGVAEVASIDAQAGIDYYIVVDGYSTGGTPPGPSGPYSINVVETTATGCIGVGGAGTAAITLSKTVGTDPLTCAVTDAITVTTGTDVTYCYTVTNTGTLTLTTHTLTDTVLGPILTNFSYNLAPSASAFITTSTTITQTTVNGATWDASDGVTNTVASDSATVDVITFTIYSPLVLR